MATYYVSTIDGNDSYNGTTPSYESGLNGPKLTIAAAVALLTTEGDTLRFVGGSQWWENFTPPTLNNITFEAYGAGNNPILRKATVLTPGTWAGPDGNGCYTYASPGTVNWFAEDGHAMKKSSGPTIPEGNGYWYQDGTPGNTLYCKASDGLSPATHTTEVLSGSGVNRPGGTATYMTIDGLHFLYGGVDFYGDRNVSNLTVQNCIFDEAWNIAIDVSTGTTIAHLDDVVIQDNTFNACMSNIYIVAAGSGYNLRTIVRRNTIAKSNFLYDGTTPWFPTGTGDYDGISIQTIKDSIIELNDVSGRCVNVDGGSAGIVVWVPANLDCSGNIVRRNFIHDVLGSGISVGGTAPVTFNPLVHDNIVINFGVNGLELNRTNSTYNNTIANGYCGIYGHATDDVYTVKNNIVYNCTFIMGFEGAPGANSVLNHNAYYPTSGDRFYYQNDPINYLWTLAEYQAYVTPQDADALTSDPLFINGNGSLDTDFKLQSGSPCINAGVDVGLTTDYGGESIVGVPDIGAWEFGGGFRKIYIGGLQCNLTVI